MGLEDGQNPHFSQRLREMGIPQPSIRETIRARMNPLLDIFL
jgi:hypothetical protein